MENTVALIRQIDEIDEKEKMFVSYDFLYDPNESTINFTDSKTR